jgi:hypothetical protein
MVHDPMGVGAACVRTNGRIARLHSFLRRPGANKGLEALTRVAGHALNCVSRYVFSRRGWSIAYLEYSSSLSEMDYSRPSWGRGLERARARAKTLKGLKTTNPSRGSRVCRSLAIIYEFGAPKKATGRGRSAASFSELRSTDFKSIRGSDKIFYGERWLFNGPYSGRGLLTSALICSQRGLCGPYRLSLESLRSLRCTLADHDIVVCLRRRIEGS